MKLLAEEDKIQENTKKIAKMSKRGVSSYHDDTPSWYNGYV
jgi:hypothetical protein